MSLHLGRIIIWLLTFDIKYEISQKSKEISMIIWIELISMLFHMDAY